MGLFRFLQQAVDGISNHHAALAIGNRQLGREQIISMLIHAGAEPTQARKTVEAVMHWGEEALLDTHQGRIALLWDAVEHLSPSA